MAGVLSYLRSVYDLENLDTRFVTPSKVPYKTVLETRADPSASKEVPGRPQVKAQPSKWNTPEFYFYGLVFLIVVPYMFWIAYDVSRPSDPRYNKFSQFLSDGWIPGRKIDVSDAQYHTFRQNLPYVALLLVGHPLCRRLWNSVFPIVSNGKRSAADEAEDRLGQRASFDYAFGLLFLTIMHGFSTLKVLAILYTNFQIATALPRKYVPAVTWAFNIGILFANELGEGYHFKAIARHLTPSLQAASLGDVEPALVNWGAWLDSWGGLMPRWEILFNITILRLISFNLDHYWAANANRSSPVEKKQLDPANLSERDRVSIPAEAKDYSFRNYIAYAIYAPLYLAGPILTFNDYVSQSKYRPPTIETGRTVRYGVRFLLALLAMELVLHYDYVGAISHGGPDWRSYTAAQLSLLSYFNLHLIWLKLLLPWRLFRLWALADGLDPTENMVRCVSNNYSTRSFWRAWHRSYNRWLTRYMYVPLGGASFRSWAGAARSVLTLGAVFTFVALWHDIQLRLLAWGWLVVLFMLPEVAAGFLFPARRWEARPTAYRMLCCVGAVGNVLMMMMANLVGFAVGLDGLQTILSSILHDWSGVLFMVVACSALFVGIQVMFELRQSEIRKGIFLNY